MKTKEIRGQQALDLELANVQWGIDKWERWSLKNNAGLIIEDGKVTGWHLEATRWHK